MTEEEVMEQLSSAGIVRRPVDDEAIEPFFAMPDH